MSSCIENGDATTTTTKKLLLRSSDGETFEVEEAVALQSQTIRLVFGDDCANKEIPVHNVTSSVLSKVIDYCKKHVDSGDDDDVTAWDADFVKVDQTTLFDLVLAANYLHIKGLLDLTCQAVADMIRQESGGDLSYVQHQKPFHSGRRRGDSKGESMGI